MNGKNLPLKFAFVALVAGLSLWSFFSRGIRQGIDLRGGHSLVFEVQAPEGTSEVGLVTSTIDRLKERIDRHGLYNLEWRPLGDNRFQVRMPAARPETRQARQAYQAQLRQIAGNNIQPSEIQQILTAEPQQREGLIAELAGPDQQLTARFNRLVETYQELQEAQQEVERLESLLAQPGRSEQVQDELDQARRQLGEANYEYEIARSELQRANISIQRLDTILRNYVSRQARQELAEAAPQELEDRTKAFEEELAKIRNDHPARVDEINQAVEFYKAWADQRQGLEDPSDLKRMIARAGVLEFRIAPRPGEIPDIGSYYRQLAEEGPEVGRNRGDDYQWFPVYKGRSQNLAGLVVSSFAGQDYVLLSNRPDDTMLRDPADPDSWKLTSARPDRDPTYNTPAVGFELDAQGARMMSQLTGANQGKSMAILLDDEVYSAPNIQAQISRRGIITGRFTPQEVTEMAQILNAGQLNARINPNPVVENSFGPSIGAVNREKGIQAGIYALIAVGVFMLVYYLLIGAVADFALMLNLVLIAGAMSLLGAVFTLPGIAGLILTVGIAVDANVLIYERLREEQARGLSVKMALQNAYDRAFSAIFDGNLTTLITCLILGWVGTEEVRGFAITLGLGVLFNLFTAVYVTRWVFQALLKGNIVKKPMRMLRLIGVPKVDWISKRYYFWGISGTLAVLGLASLAWQGSDIWGIEFSAGTEVTINFEPDALVEINGQAQLPDDENVQTAFNAAAIRLGYNNLAATARVEERLDPTRVERFVRRFAEPNADQVSRDQYVARGGNPEFFGRLDANNDGVLAMPELQNMPTDSYQVSTTEVDLDNIRDTAREAFGASLENRVALDYNLVKGEEIDRLDVILSPGGMTQIQPGMAARVSDPTLKDVLNNFAGGVMFVVADVTPPTTPQDIEQRIQDVRVQPTRLSRVSMNETRVFELGGAARNSVAGSQNWSRFAVLVRPSDTDVLDDPQAWESFARNEWEVVQAALEREEAMAAMNFDPAIAGNTAGIAIMAFILSWLAIIGYVWLRFGSARWGLAAVICLIHDAAIVVGMVAVSGWLHDTFIGRALGIGSFKVDLAMVAAVLTVIGYSVNDTIVVFDRIRENRGKLTAVNPYVINSSINQTLSRTLLTTGTTFIVLLIMYIAGGQSIRGFNYALLIGVLIGSYSSIAVASPILLGFKRAVLAKTVGTQE